MLTGRFFVIAISPWSGICSAHIVCVCMRQHCGLCTWMAIFRGYVCVITDAQSVSWLQQLLWFHTNLVVIENANCW